jgi:hypothetical protein
VALNVKVATCTWGDHFHFISNEMEKIPVAMYWKNV